MREVLLDFLDHLVHRVWRVHEDNLGILVLLVPQEVAVSLVPMDLLVLRETQDVMVRLDQWDHLGLRVQWERQVCPECQE